MYTPSDRWDYVLDDLYASNYKRIRSILDHELLPIGTTTCASFSSGTGTIRVYRSANQSAVYPIVFFRHTMLMNYLSFDHMCVAYPALTFTGRGAITTRALQDYEYDLLDNDKAHGYNIHETIPSSVGELGCMACPVCPRLLRTMRDICCSFIRLTTERIRLVRYNVEWKTGATGCPSCCATVRELKVQVRDAGDMWL